jgi:hypothetical protein
MVAIDNCVRLLTFIRYAHLQFLIFHALSDEASTTFYSFNHFLYVEGPRACRNLLPNTRILT